MMQQPDFRTMLRAALDETDLTVVELAAISGVNKSTIHRALNEAYEFTPSGKTMAKIMTAILSHAHKTSDEQFYATIRSNVPRKERQLRITELVGTGYWLSRPKRQAEAGKLSQICSIDEADPAFQHAGRVLDDSFAPHYRQGDTIHLVDVRVPGFLKLGCDVVVSDIRFKDSAITDTELTIRRVEAFDLDGWRIASLPGVDASSKKVPLQVPVGKELGMISGIVVGLYRPT